MKVYLDNAATTRVDERVLEAMKPFFLEKYGNPASLHSFGIEARKAVDDARDIVAKAINAQKGEIVFTSGGSESNNLAIKGAIAAGNLESIACSAIEHPAVLNVCKALEKQGVKTRYLPVSSDGAVSVDDVAQALDEGVQLVSVMHANNEIGTIQPIKEIGVLCRKKKALFHVDAVQSLNKLPIDVNELSVDFMSFSSHKLHGPKGVGALFAREGVQAEPLIHGGGHERGLRSGTENVSGMVGFAKAVELAHDGLKKNATQMTKLRNQLIDAVLEDIKDSRLNGSREKRLCNNANFSFKHVEGESLVMELDSKGVAASTGSACSSRSLEASHVLLAIGLSHLQAHGSLRLTLSRFTTQEEIDYALKVLPKALKKFRGISPF